MSTEQQVIDALVGNNFSVVDEYLKSNDINKIFTKGSLYQLHGTLLHFACYMANEAAVIYLLNKNANPNVDSPTSPLNSGELRKAKPIHFLLTSGEPILAKEKVLTLLLKAGANINGLNEFSRTPLDTLLTSRYDKRSNFLIENLALLIKHKADINSRDMDGKISLFHALDRATKNPGTPNEEPGFELEACQFLLENHARPEILVHLNDGTYNAADYALHLRKHRCYDLLKAKLPESELEKRMSALENFVQKLDARVVKLEAALTETPAQLPDERIDQKSVTRSFGVFK